MCIGKKNKEIQPFFIVFLVGKSKLICFSNFASFLNFWHQFGFRELYYVYINYFLLGVVCTNFILFEPEPEPHDLFIF